MCLCLVREWLLFCWLLFLRGFLQVGLMGCLGKQFCLLRQVHHFSVKLLEQFRFQLKFKKSFLNFVLDFGLVWNYLELSLLDLAKNFGVEDYLIAQCRSYHRYQYLFHCTRQKQPQADSNPQIWEPHYFCFKISRQSSLEFRITGGVWMFSLGRIAAQEIKQNIATKTKDLIIFPIFLFKFIIKLYDLNLLISGLFFYGSGRQVGMRAKLVQKTWLRQIVQNVRKPMVIYPKYEDFQVYESRINLISNSFHWAPAENNLPNYPPNFRNKFNINFDEDHPPVFIYYFLQLYENLSFYKMDQTQKTTIKFTAMDYTSDDTFQQAEYTFCGSMDSGWTIQRNDKLYLQLGKGYQLLKVIACGICSTDLDRRFLPFPLPQITGHELVAYKMASSSTSKSQRYVVEINDTYQARGDQNKDSFCLAGIPTHSPERRTLGINMLPGGFGSFILAPKNAIISCNFLPDQVAVLIQPFAAALQALISSPPKNNDSIAVLGPRRLGSLILAALKADRNSNKINFHITSIVRHQNLQKLSLSVGADEVINLKTIQPNTLKNKYDIIYDTTSTPSGFLMAMQLTRKELHLKTTNGQSMGGLSHLTQLVVDQLSLLPIENIDNFEFHWKTEDRRNKTIYVSPSLKQKYQFLRKQYQIFSGSPSQALNYLNSIEDKKQLPRFDLAIAGNPFQIGKCIRPCAQSADSLVRPRGAILIDVADNEGWEQASQARQFFKQGKQIHSSRCGDFHLALKLLKENPEIVEILRNNMISHVFDSKQLAEAFKKAREPKSVKVIIKNNLNPDKQDKQ